jgi:hypothetical protein
MYNSTHSVTFALNGCEWSASRLGRFTPKGRAPRTHWIGSWVGPRAILDTVVKRKIPSPCWDSNPSLTSIECQINNHWVYQDTQKRVEKETKE